eukprot:gene2195-33751_t
MRCDLSSESWFKSYSATSYGTRAQFPTQPLSTAPLDEAELVTQTHVLPKMMSERQLSIASALVVAVILACSVVPGADGVANSPPSPPPPRSPPPPITKIGVMASANTGNAPPPPPPTDDEQYLLSIRGHTSTACPGLIDETNRWLQGVLRPLMLMVLNNLGYLRNLDVKCGYVDTSTTTTFLSFNMKKQHNAIFLGIMHNDSMAAKVFAQAALNSINSAHTYAYMTTPGNPSHVHTYL